MWWQKLEWCGHEPRRTRNANSHQKLEQSRKHSPLKSPEGMQPCWNAELWENKFLLFYATKILVICYSTHRKPIQAVTHNSEKFLSKRMASGVGWEDERNRWGRLRGTNFQLLNKCHRYEIYSVGNTVNNNVISLWWQMLTRLVMLFIL